MAIKTIVRFSTVQKVVAAIVSFIVLMSACVGIIEFVLHIIPPPPPEPLISESSYQTQSPGCDASQDPPDLTWRISAATNTCPPGDSGTLLTMNNLNYVGALVLDAATGHEFAPNHEITATFTQLAASDCAGIATRGIPSSDRQYVFYVCGNGDWYILKYSGGHGLPEVLAQSGVNGAAYPAAPRYQMAVTVDGSHLEMSVNRGSTYSVTDTDYSIAEEIGVDVSGDYNLTNPGPSVDYASVLVSNFQYQAS